MYTEPFCCSAKLSERTLPGFRLMNIPHEFVYPSFFFSDPGDYWLEAVYSGGAYYRKQTGKVRSDPAWICFAQTQDRFLDIQVEEFAVFPWN